MKQLHFCDEISSVLFDEFVDGGCLQNKSRYDIYFSLIVRTNQFSLLLSFIICCYQILFCNIQMTGILSDINSAEKKIDFHFVIGPNTVHAVHVRKGLQVEKQKLQYILAFLVHRGFPFLFFMP